MQRLIAQTIVLQGLGVLLMLGTTLLIARAGGAPVQGSFALVKSINDLQVALFCFGMPSAIVYLLNRTGSGHRVIYRWARRYTFLLLLTLPAVNIGLMSLINPGMPWTELLTRAALIGVASACGTGFALLRALLLVHTDGTMFSIMSILPWAIIAACVAFLIQRSPFVIEIAYGVSGVVSLWAIDWWVRRLLFAKPGETEDGPIDLRVLKDQSINILVQATLFGVQVFMTNALLEAQDASLRSAGLFNVASMVITLPNLLVALAAPVLFNRWSKMLDLGGYRQIRNNSLKLAALAQGLAIAAIPLIAPLLALVFGAQFVQARDACLVMLFAVFAVFATRIITPALQGIGGNRTVTWSCVARLTAVGAGFAAVSLIGYSWLLAVSVGWALGEYAALMVLLWAQPPLKAANQEAAGADYRATSLSVEPTR